MIVPVFEDYSVRKLCKLLPHNLIRQLLGYSYLEIIRYPKDNLHHGIYDHIWVDNIENVINTEGFDISSIEIEPTLFGYHISLTNF